MNFYAVWGFDPDEQVNADKALNEAQKSLDEEYTRLEEWEARVPLGSWAQIHELERMFEL